jgi:hypothetical protein
MHFSNADFMKLDQQIVHDLFGKDRVVSVKRMLFDVFSHPLGQRQPCARHSIVEESLDSSNDFLDICALLRALFNPLLNFEENSPKITLSEQDLLCRKLFDLWRAFVVKIGSEKELLSP